jgi:dipeptide transport system substrate-binding protein
MFYNTTKAPMSNLKLRQGIAKAINFDEYSKVVNLGLIPPMRSIFRTDSPFYDANTLQPAYDPTAAQALFDQAAAELGTDVITIPLETLDPRSYQTSAQYIQGALNKYKHINVTYSATSPATHLSTCNQRQFPGICHFAVFFDDPDPAWVNYFLCSSPVNPSGWCNTEFDRLIQDNRTTLDPKQRVQDIKDAVKLVYAEQPSLWTEYRYSWNAHASNVQDLAMVNDGAVLFDRLWFKR